MFQNNNPDYYNDAVRDARVNTQSEEHQDDSKGKLLLISNLILISIVLGYFIYQDMQKEPKTAVKGVNYTVNIHEDENSNTINNSTISKVIKTETPQTEITKEKDISNLGNLIDNSSVDSSPYLKALDKELTGVNSKKVEKSQHNQKLENILADIDTQGFSETTNVIKIENEPEIDTELDIDELANLVNSLVVEEL